MGLLFIGAVVLHIIIIIVDKHLLKKFSKARFFLIQNVLLAFRKPAVVLIWYIAIINILIALSLIINDSSIENLLNHTLKVGVTIICVWYLFRLINTYEKRAHKSKRCYDKTTVDGLTKIAKIILALLAALVILQSLGIPLAAIYSAAGGVGIGITLAAQDMLRNFFGGLVLYFDRPFSIGDWISSPDKQIEGTVEKIGWRSTRIRTFDKRPLYVPNATFLTVSVENPSRMLHRRIRTDIGVRYRDAKQLPAITNAIEVMLRGDEDIAAEETIWVNLVDFASSSLTFRIYAFTKTTEWVQFQKIQQKIFLKVIEIIQQFDADIAFPTRTLDVPDNVNIVIDEKEK